MGSPFKELAAICFSFKTLATLWAVEGTGGLAEALIRVDFREAPAVVLFTQKAPEPHLSSFKTLASLAVVALVAMVARMPKTNSSKIVFPAAAAVVVVVLDTKAAQAAPEGAGRSSPTTETPEAPDL
jgi:hypothetical protein